MARPHLLDTLDATEERLQNFKLTYYPEAKTLTKFWTLSAAW
jgi:hypothetical protein